MLCVTEKNGGKYSNLKSFYQLFNSFLNLGKGQGPIMECVSQLSFPLIAPTYVGVILLTSIKAYFSGGVNRHLFKANHDVILDLKINIKMEGNFHSVPTEDLDSTRVNLPVRTDNLFGISCFKPAWLQRFANPKVYLVIFCMIGVLQGAYFTYFIGVLSTLEKRYAFESKISGIILIADNISGAVISILVGFYARKGHKPQMMAFGMIFVSISCFISSLPYYLYGPALHFLSRDDAAFGNKKQEYCGSVSEETGCENAENNSMIPAVTILFIANFLNGFGYAAYYTVGSAYLDDNVKKKNSPMYFCRYINFISVNK